STAKARRSRAPFARSWTCSPRTRWNPSFSPQPRVPSRRSECRQIHRTRHRPVQREAWQKRAGAEGEKGERDARDEGAGELGGRLAPVEETERDRLQEDRPRAEAAPQAEQQEAAEEPLPAEEVEAV